jgi:hypothetical protein
MNRNTRAKALLILVAAGLMPVTAQAQWIHTPNQPPPLYPYVAQPSQPYAVQVSPGTYVIHRPEDARAEPRRQRRHRHAVKPAAINTTQIVRDKPVVRETTRYVDDPPRVVERYVDGNGKPVRGKSVRSASRVTIDAPVLDKPKGKDDSVKRVVHAEAEITIIGPDRMNIRLYRKGGKPAAD